MSFNFGGTGGTSNFGFGGFGQPQNPVATPLTATAATPSGQLGSATQPSLFGTSTFGSNTNPSGTAATQPNLFGTTGSGAQNQPGIFGNNPTSTFGSTGATTATGMFGSSTQPSIFGSTSTQPATSMFGSNTQPSSIFGTSNMQSTAQPSLFGTNQPSISQNQSNPFSMQGSMNANSTETSSETLNTIISLYQSFYPSNPSCVFQHVFYNIVHPNDVQLYGRPPNMSERLYQQALADNPDPACMVPVLAVGYQDLEKRITKQKESHETIKSKLKEISSLVEALHQKQCLENVVKIDEFKRKHCELSFRILKLIRKLELIRNRGHTLRPEEESLRNRIENILLTLNKTGKLKAQLLQLMVKCDANRPQYLDYTGANVDEMYLKHMQKVLLEQQKGISCLADILKKSESDVSVMENS